MNLISIFFIAIGLAMDAFAVSVSGGVAAKKPRINDALKLGLFFGFFQGAMPVIGWLAGAGFKSYISGFDHWIAFLLLGAIGLHMIHEAKNKDEECGEEDISHLSIKLLIALAVATSIDALIVGVGFGVLNAPLVSAALIIGIVTFILSFWGYFIGNKFGCMLSSWSEYLGGAFLIAIGLKILLQHTIFM